MYKIMYIIADIICFDKNKWRFTKMNKYIKLIESKAIREYLDEIGYIPSAFEAAYIVDTCKKLTLKEKHKFWNEIIETSSDEKLEKEFKLGKLTLHEFLSKYMEIQNILCEQFLKKEDNVIYTCSSGVVVDSFGKPIIKDPFYWCNLYADLDLCIQDAFEKQYPPYDVRKHYIKTNLDDTDYKCIWADFSKDGEITNIGEVFALNENDSEICLFFKLETVSIPLPFKKGDLIYSKYWDCADYELMAFNHYKDGYIYVDQCCKSDNKGFSVKNDLDLEFIDKAQCAKVLEDAVLVGDSSFVEFITQQQILSENDIIDIYQKI